MNARRRAQQDGLPSRVYKRDGSFYWVRPDNKWIRLVRVSEGETRMLERLVEEKRRFQPVVGTGNLPRIVGLYMELHANNYADTYREEWLRRGEVIAKCLQDWNVAAVDASAVEDFLTENWPEAPSMQKAMKAWLSTFFSWCVRKKHAATNPTREVKVKKPPSRKVYISDAVFMQIREALMLTKPNKRTGVRAKVPTGPMMQCFIDLCYLTMQRSTEIRNLRWSVDERDRFSSSYIDRDSGIIHFMPSKTEDSSGEMVDWPITPQIDAVLQRAKLLKPAFGQKYVIRDRKGNPKTDGACRDAWERAMERCGLDTSPYTIKDIRAKAMTDAKRLGYKIEEIQVGGAHTDPQTTVGYIKSREVPVSNIVLSLPARKSA